MPAIPLGELDELAAEEAELEENIRRVDLSWQERAAATAKLNSLRTKLSVAAGQPLPSVADISQEVRGSSAGIHQETTRREIVLAKHLGNPAVAGAKSVDEAWKALKREEGANRSRELAETIGRTFTAASHHAIQMDSLEWMAHVAAEQFDVILTDPPYGIAADEFGDSGGHTAGGHQYDDSEENFVNLMQAFWVESFRLAKPQAHLYCFCDLDWFHVMKRDAATAGWKVFRTPLIWHKPGAFRAPWPQHGPQRKYEICLYAIKGERPALKLAPDVITINPDANLGHMAQKPVALFEELLRRSAHPGDLVLDPFMGTGTIFPAAHALKVRAIGIERDAGSYGIALQRIQQLKEEEK